MGSWPGMRSTRQDRRHRWPHRGRADHGNRRLRKWMRGVFLALAVVCVGLPLALDAVSALLRPARSDQGICRMVTVIDGDTVTLWCRGQGVERARLTGFDTPELFSPGCASEYLAAQKAKWALRGMILSAGEMRVTRQGRDRYGRALVAVTLDGIPLAQRMVGAGHARAYDGGPRQGWCGKGWRPLPPDAAAPVME